MRFEFPDGKIVEMGDSDVRKISDELWDSTQSGALSTAVMLRDELSRPSAARRTVELTRNQGRVLRQAAGRIRETH